MLFSDPSSAPDKFFEFAQSKGKAQYAADLPATCFSDRTRLMNLNTDTKGHVKSITKEADGITKGYVYVGQQFSHSALHVENDNLASVNFIHKGAPKYWFGFSADSADQIDKIARDTMGMDCNNPLFHRSFLVNPLMFLNYPEIKVFKAVQHAGEFIVTQCKAYHQVFNLGANLAEAINIGPALWLRYREQIASCNCQGERAVVPADLPIDLNQSNVEQHTSRENNYTCRIKHMVPRVPGVADLDNNAKFKRMRARKPKRISQR